MDTGTSTQPVTPEEELVKRAVRPDVKYFDSERPMYFRGRKVKVDYGHSSGWIMIRTAVGSFYIRPFMLQTEEEYLASLKD